MGNLDELKKTYPDPIAHFKNIAQERNKAGKAERFSTIEIDFKTELEQEFFLGEVVYLS